MKAQYYYEDPESQKTRGPLGLEEIRELIEERALDPATLICRVLADEWQTFDAYPELLPTTVKLALPPVPAAAPRRRRLAGTLAAAVAILALAAGVYAWQAPILGWATFPRWPFPPHPVPVAAVTPVPAPAATPAVAVPVVPAPGTVAPVTSEPANAELTSAAPVSAIPAAILAPAATPAASPAGDPELGVKIAARILDQHPKLKVAVISGISFPKPDGVELYGTGAFGASICFILPEESWYALSDSEKLDLEAYVADRVGWVREHAEDYMIIPRSAPDYDKDLDRARHLVDGAWRIGSTQTYSDDPDGNLYLKRNLAKGIAY